MNATSNQDKYDSVPQEGSDTQASNQATVLDSCVVTYASVLHIELDDIPKVLAFIRTLPNAKLIYSMKSVGAIRLVKD